MKHVINNLNLMKKHVQDYKMKILLTKIRATHPLKPSCFKEEDSASRQKV
jgi:hypothetical protein